MIFFGFMVGGQDADEEPLIEVEGVSRWDAEANVKVRVGTNAEVATAEACASVSSSFIGAKWKQG